MQAMSNIPDSVTVKLPAPSGRYNDDFGCGVTIGAASSSRTEGVWVWLQPRGEMTPDEARELAAALLAAACGAEIENQSGG